MIRYQYRKALVMLEKGGRTYRVIDNLQKHTDGKVTMEIVAPSLPDKIDALNIAKKINYGKGMTNG